MKILRFIGLLVLGVSFSMVLAEEVQRSRITNFLLPAGAWSLAGTEQANRIERIIDSLAAKAGSECSLFEAVYWDRSSMPRGPKAIKEDVVARLKRRGWTYRIIDQDGTTQVFLTGGGYTSILGGWVETQVGELVLAWCLLR